MAQFMGDVAFLLELALVAAGLVLLHTGRLQSAALLRAAGWTLVVGATATATCTTYFWVRYHQAGEFDHARSVLLVGEVASKVDSLEREAVR